MRRLAFSVMLALPILAGSFASSSAQTATSATDKASPPAHPATEDQIREYLSLIRMDKMAHELMDSMVKSMQATSAPYYPASFWEDMRAEMQKIDLVAVYVTVYQKYLSQSDMQAVIDFYRSSSGSKLLEVQPFAIRDAQGVLRQKGADVGKAVYLKHKDEIEAAKKSYETAPPAQSAH